MCCHSTYVAAALLLAWSAVCIRETKETGHLNLRESVHAKTRGREGDGDPFECRGDGNHQSCLFHNLCFDTRSPSSQTLLYFANGALPFETMTLNIRPPYTNAAWPPPASDAVSVTIKAMPGALPADAAISPDETTVLIQTMFEFNFGHLMDSVWTAYRMQRSFDIPLDARVMTWNGPGKYHGKSWNGFVSKVFSTITKNDQKVGLQSLTSPEMVQHLLKMSKNQKPHAQYLCFPKVVVGAGPFSFTNPAERSPHQWWSFRSFVIKNFGTGSFNNDIVISKKSILNRWGGVTSNGFPDAFDKIMAAGGKVEDKYNHYMGRIGKLQEKLQKTFPDQGVDVIDYAELPMKDQVLMTSKLKVLITSPGGGSFVAMFLPQHASLIVTVEHDLGDDAVRFFENEYLLWKSFPWLSFRKVSDMMSGEVESEVRNALAKRVSIAPGIANNLTGAQTAQELARQRTSSSSAYDIHRAVTKFRSLPRVKTADERVSKGVPLSDSDLVNSNRHINTWHLAGVIGLVAFVASAFLSLRSSNGQVDGKNVAVVIVFWMMMSFAMNLLNKQCTVLLRCPFTLVLIQMCVSIVVLAPTPMSGFRKQDLWRWSALAVLFGVMLCSSMFALTHSSVTCFLVLRNCLPLLTLPAEKALFGNTIPASMSAVASLCAIALGAALYARFAPGSDTTYTGMVWILLNCIATVSHRVLERYLLTTDMTLSFQAMTLINNVVPLFPVGLLAWATGETAQWPQYAHVLHSPMAVAVLACSGMVGLCLGQSSIMVQKCITATTMMVLMTMNKLFIILAAMFFFHDHLTPMSFFGCTLSLVGCACHGMLQHSSKEVSEEKLETGK